MASKSKKLDEAASQAQSLAPFEEAVITMSGAAPRPRIAPQIIGRPHWPAHAAASSREGVLVFFGRSC
jgi:hypothetical protein